MSKSVTGDEILKAALDPRPYNAGVHRVMTLMIQSCESMLELDKVSNYFRVHSAETTYARSAVMWTREKKRDVYIKWLISQLVEIVPDLRKLETQSTIAAAVHFNDIQDLQALYKELFYIQSDFSEYMDKFKVLMNLTNHLMLWIKDILTLDQSLQMSLGTGVVDPFAQPTT